MNLDLNTIAYFIYLPVTIALTIFTSKKLFKNGKVFMIDIFHGKEQIAHATNQLFEIGFYLLNIGFALFTIQMYKITSNNDLIVSLSTKIGGFTIYLGLLLFVNILLFIKGRNNARKPKKVSRSEPITQKLEK